MKKVVSGGQTGADRAGLDVAMVFNIPVGGWCPKGRKAEDGPIDRKYPLQETKSDEYRVRTELNVRESDGTLIFTSGKPCGGGTALTIENAKELGKPFLVVDLKLVKRVDMVKEWLIANNIEILNIAGPRASEKNDIYREVKVFLVELFGS